MVSPGPWQIALREANTKLHVLMFAQPSGLGGGLVIHNLKALNDALRSKWLWIAKTSNLLPSSALNLLVSAEATVIFQASGTISIHSSTSALFWQDHWIADASLTQLTPDLVAMVKPAALANAWSGTALKIMHGHVT